MYIKPMCLVVDKLYVSRLAIMYEIETIRWIGGEIINTNNNGKCQ